MSTQPDYSDELERILTNETPANLTNIESRVCSSSQNDGREYELYGSYIPIRPIIDLAGEKDGFRIEHIGFVDESTTENEHEPHLNVFFADVRRSETHPAFTDER